jgi:MOB kinase activator 1
MESQVKCPVMSAGPKYEYLWMDERSEQYKKPTKVSAPLYIELMFNWIDEQLSDPRIFPIEDGM